MSIHQDEPMFTGLPMELDALEPGEELPYPLPADAKILTIEEARTSLK